MKRRRRAVDDDIVSFSSPSVPSASLACLPELTKPTRSSECINPKRTKEVRAWLERCLPYNSPQALTLPVLFILQGELPCRYSCSVDPPDAAGQPPSRFSARRWG